MSDIVITGVGMLASSGPSAETAWQSMAAGRVSLRPLSDAAGHFCGSTNGGEITGFDATDHVPLRLARKLDPFCQFAVAAAKMAVADSKLDLERADRTRVGVYVANCFGGWRYTDRELRNLHQAGVRSVSPFQATAWFPTAPQGQITILLGLNGHSKTLDCGRASGLASIGYAARAIQAGRCDVVIAGGSEAVANPFVLTACSSEGVREEDHRISRNGRYQPFGVARDGWLIGEGAGFVVLERREHAQERGARVYAGVSGFALTHEACHPDYARSARGLEHSIKAAIDEARTPAKAVDVVMADAAGTPLGDRFEAEALRNVLGDRFVVSVPRTMIGQSYGAAGAIDTVLGAMSIHQGCILPTVGIDEVDAACGVNLVRESALKRQVGPVLINGRGTGGVCASLLLSA
jgi:3-oxoacyl-[acyl-carrier-protein] synthase II